MRLIDADRLMSDFLCTIYNDLDDLNRTEKLINEAPTVEEQPHGEWVFDSNFTAFGNPYGTYKCSVCGGHSSNKYSFCKDCGADMRKEGEAE